MAKWQIYDIVALDSSLANLQNLFIVFQNQRCHAEVITSQAVRTPRQILSNEKPRITYHFQIKADPDKLQIVDTALSKHGFRRVTT